MVTFAAAYALVWFALTFYVGWMASRQRRLIAEFARLEKQFSEGKAPAADDQPAFRRAA